MTTISRLSVACSLAMLLTACGAPSIAPPPGYLLASATAAGNDTVEIQVHLAGYLAQGGIVLQLSDSEVHSARSHRWAEPLAQQLQRSLHAALGDTIRPEGAQLVVRVSQFHGVRSLTGDRAVIQGTWHYSTKHGEPRRGTIDWQRGIPTDGYGALVETLDQGWRDASMSITEALREGQL